MKFQKNTKLGKVNFLIYFLLVFFYFTLNSTYSDKFEKIKKYTEIKILDKISSKNTLIQKTNNIMWVVQYMDKNNTIFGAYIFILIKSTKII